MFVFRLPSPGTPVGVQGLSVSVTVSRQGQNRGLGSFRPDGIIGILLYIVKVGDVVSYKVFLTAAAFEANKPDYASDGTVAQREEGECPLINVSVCGEQPEVRMSPACRAGCAVIGVFRRDDGVVVRIQKVEKGWAALVTLSKAQLLAAGFELTGGAETTNQVVIVDVNAGSLVSRNQTPKVVRLTPLDERGAAIVASEVYTVSTGGRGQTPFVQHLPNGVNLGFRLVEHVKTKEKCWLAFGTVIFKDGPRFRIERASQAEEEAAAARAAQQSDRKTRTIRMLEECHGPVFYAQNLEKKLTKGVLSQTQWDLKEVRGQLEYNDDDDCFVKPADGTFALQFYHKSVGGDEEKKGSVRCAWPNRDFQAYLPGRSPATMSRAALLAMGVFGKFERDLDDGSKVTVDFRNTATATASASTSTTASTSASTTASATASTSTTAKRKRGVNDDDVAEDKRGVNDDDVAEDDSDFD